MSNGRREYSAAHSDDCQLDLCGNKSSRTSYELPPASRRSFKYNHGPNALPIKATRSGGLVRCRRSNFLMGITESLTDVFFPTGDEQFVESIWVIRYCFTFGDLDSHCNKSEKYRD